MLGDETEQVSPTADIGVAGHNNPRAEAFGGRMAQCQFRQIDCGHWPSSIVKNAGDTDWSLRQLLESQQGNNLHDPGCVQGISIAAQLEDQEEHRRSQPQGRAVTRQRLLFIPGGELESSDTCLQSTRCSVQLFYG